MRALSIRQAYVELILRGEKKVEYRSRPTKVIGERFYIYAANQPGEMWAFRKLRCEPGDLPTGVILGTAIISHCTRGPKYYHWHLTKVKRLKAPRKPKNHPQPAWFNPF